MSTPKICQVLGKKKEMQLHKIERFALGLSATKIKKDRERPKPELNLLAPVWLWGNTQLVLTQQIESHFMLSYIIASPGYTTIWLSLKL